ncbi:MAG TPA: hypothetical protein QF851_03075, partial [Flavobacteriales bacterium]|nr:hypothetical protein [Flavobacteriales bacterium]
TKYATISNLILGTKHNKFKLKINSTKELETLISSWRAIGVNIEPQTLLTVLTNKIENIGLQNDTKVIKRCSDILGPYSEDNNAFEDFYNHSNQLWLNKMSKLEIKEEIIRRANKSRAPVNGKYLRDHQLALLFKKYHKPVCVVCGDNQNIEISHKIPLNLGHDNYAFDLPFNMDLCCHSCHKRYEKNFDSKYENSKDKEKFLKETHQTDVRNSVWTKHINSKVYKISEKPKYSGIMKCVKCLKRYRKVKLCKSCNNDVLPIEDPFFKIIRSEN